MMSNKDAAVITFAGVVLYAILLLVAAMNDTEKADQGIVGCTQL